MYLTNVHCQKMQPATGHLALKPRDSTVTYANNKHVIQCSTPKWLILVHNYWHCSNVAWFQMVRTAWYTNSLWSLSLFIPLSCGPAIECFSSTQIPEPTKATNTDPWRVTVLTNQTPTGIQNSDLLVAAHSLPYHRACDWMLNVAKSILIPHGRSSDATPVANTVMHTCHI